jgi:hypothetical protein
MTMKRLLAGPLMAVAIGVTGVFAVAGCGSVHGASAAQSGLTGAGMASGKPGHSMSSPPGPASHRWLPALTGRQVARGHLLPRKWALVRLADGGRAAEISFRFGACLPHPKGVVETQSGTAVTLGVEAPQPRLAAFCATKGTVETAWVHLPALAGRELRHAP